MQCNSPFGGYFFQTYAKTASPPPTPQIVGEGDVNALTFPDGSVQLFFVPIIKQNCLASPYGNLFSCPTAEIWFVRSITYPQANLNISVPPGYFHNQLPSTFGECPPYSPPNYNTNTYPPIYHEYTQKFHNDTWTSTTDLQYFYPSLRRTKCVQYSTVTQTEIPYPNIMITENQCNKTCRCCKSGIYLRCVNNEHLMCNSKVQTKSSDSCMSVDNEESDIGHRKNEKSKKKLRKNKKSSNRNHICECKLDKRDTSDKFVTTYADQATDNITKDGRKIQTEAPKSNKQKPKAGNTKSILKWVASSQSDSVDDSCTCSTSGTEQR